ncbi:MAG: tetratricopeptide repeat protein [Candidatus Thermoplasmatota archaeon]|nr:tetratricopeptide repeat protein [Candidatus Thermoplasmatota archaeon]MBU4070732.1 tetratricopeptide repeat protein [Candidatus Thermoplasmatota archaeon]MBU4145172.1 tetratricopeptide repeat protein [Candidatus Thermoplasmatota archaeon]MBU4591528.1 tetratricopeptide repeat protein [Candidatus Thermoplasmatota archaeon]
MTPNNISVKSINVEFNAGRKRKVMSKELTKQIIAIMEREMSDIGGFIVKKQCMLIGSDPNDIEPADLPKLASQLSEVMRTFGGYEKARIIYSEIKKLENLDKVAEGEKSEEKRNKMLEDLGMTCIFAAEWDKAFDYFNKLLGAARAANDNIQISRYLQKLGFIHQERSEFDQALNYYENALEAAEDAKDMRSIGESCNLIGGIYWNKGNYQKATQHLEKAIEYALKAEDMKILGSAHIGLGNIHSDIHETKEAITHYQNALKYLKDTNEVYEISRAYNNLGDTYLQLGEWQKALEQFEKCKEYGEKGGWLNMMAWAEFNSSEALIHLGKMDLAKSNLDRSLDMLKKIGDRVGLGGIYQNYGRLYAVQKDWLKMSEYYRKAVEIFMEINHPISLAMTYEEFGIALKNKGDCEEAKVELRRAANLYLYLELETQLKRILKEIEGC